MKTSALETHHKVGEMSPPMDMKLSEPHSLNLLAYSKSQWPVTGS